MIDLAALSLSVQAAARPVNNSMAGTVAAGPSPELLQRVAFIAMLVRVVAARQQQLRAQPAPSFRDRLSPVGTTSQRDLVVQKIATGIARAQDEQLENRAEELVSGTVKGAAGAAAAAGLAAIASGGFAAGGAAATAALSSALAAAPAAAPLATLGIIGSIVIPTIVSGELFSNKIDPYFDATTPAAMARARAQAALIRQDLTDTGYKFARKAGVLEAANFLGG